MQVCRANVIIVEDDMGLNRAVARLLNIAGFHSSSFESAERLLESAAASGADCFVFDIHLPGISGVELLDRLDEAGIHRPVIFITAHDDAHTRDAARGGSSYLTKPFTGQALIQAIDAALTPSP
ncbi:response regulator transcription factor [Peristeroidobacter agariperforans]|uniref:response regulator transcription factor n=1 Tax=Peristeroidobacter agariperforans TaxID=268404 RepID=UPI00101C2B00|nr:response regulator [Peristeroidobacter agariperforans]